MRARWWPYAWCTVSVINIALASCVVVHVEPSRAPMPSAPLDAGVPPGVTCTTEAVPGAPTVCVDSRENVLAPQCSLSTTGALDKACGSALTVPDEFTHGEDPMPLVGGWPQGTMHDSGTTTWMPPVEAKQ